MSKLELCVRSLVLTLTDCSQSSDFILTPTTVSNSYNCSRSTTFRSSEGGTAQWPQPQTCGGETSTPKRLKVWIPRQLRVCKNGQAVRLHLNPWHLKQATLKILPSTPPTICSQALRVFLADKEEKPFQVAMMVLTLEITIMQCWKTSI